MESLKEVYPGVQTERTLIDREKVEGFTEALESNGFSRSELHAQAESDISFDPLSSSLEGADNFQYGVFSELHGVLRAGDSLFGIMSTRLDEKDGEPTYLLSRIVPDGTKSRRAEIIGTISPDGRPFDIGRSHQQDLDPMVSRDHCQIQIENGEIHVVDGSTNGTELFTHAQVETAKPSTSYDEGRFSAKSLMRMFRDEPAPQEAATDTENPLRNINSWAPPSTDLKAHILHEAYWSDKKATRQELDGILAASEESSDASPEKASQAFIWQELKDLTEPEALQSMTEHIQQQLDMPEMQDVAAGEQKMSSINQRINSRYKQGAGDWRLDKADNDEIIAIQQAIKEKYGEEALDTYHDLTRRKRDIQETQEPYFNSEDSARVLQELLQGAENREATNQARLFVPNYRTDMIRQSPGREMHLLLDRSEDKVNIPVGMFVSAEGLKSWEEGRGYGETKNGKESHQEIKDNAERPAETAPHVDQASAYLLPDGRLYVVSENSHRVASAIRRGDEYIKFRGSLSVRVLDETPQALRDDPEA